MSKENYRRLGDYIREVDVRNRDLEVKELLGINIGKYFMPSVANVVGTDLSNYKIVYKNQFACNLMHVGRDEKIPIAILDDFESAIVSPAYFTFEISDYDVLLPQYLMMWFRKPEFDREAWFYTDGDVRGGMSKSALLDMSLPVPPIEQQRKIVAEYEAVSRRIRLNEQMITRLEETAQTLYRKMFVDGIDKENLPEGWRMGTLEVLCESIIAGTIPIYSDSSQYLVLGQKCNYNGYIDLSKARRHILKANSTLLQFGDILVNSTGEGTLGRVGQIYFQPQNLTFDSNMTMIRVKEEYMIEYVGCYLLQKKDLFVNMSQGSTNQTRLYCSMIRPLEIIIPDYNALNAYSKSCRPIKLFIEQKRQENNKLQELQSLQLVKMGH